MKNSQIVRRAVFPGAIISTILSMPFSDPRGKGMHHLWRLWLPLLAISFLTPAQATEVGEGVIQGVVLGEEGRPVRGAKVHAELKGVAMHKAIRYVETDENGFFVIDQLEFGTYYVSAKNEKEEYGDSGFSFFNDQPVPMAQISAQHRIAEVVVNLGPKAGILTGTISDAATGKPIPAGFDLAQVKDRTKWMGTSATPSFRVLIPSSKEMEVKVSAPGYEAWVYPDPSIPSQVLRMDPGSEIHLDIQLKPVHDRSLSVSKFLIPEGYVGWLRVEYDVECFPPIPVGDGVRILRFARANVLETSSPMPEDAAERQYFYYAEDGSERNLAADYRSGNGMIWQETSGSRGGKMRMFIFFVGTEEQSKTRPHTGFLAPVCP
jgi:Family of unknown function (DUF6843)